MIVGVWVLLGVQLLGVVTVPVGKGADMNMLDFACPHRAVRLHVPPRLPLLGRGDQLRQRGHRPPLQRKHPSLAYPTLKSDCRA